MRAAIVERPGLDHLVVTEIPEPKPGPDEVLVRLRAASLNYRDTLTVVGGYGSKQKQSGLIPLSDGAGEVAALGPGVTRWRVGDRVIGCLFPNWIEGEIDVEKISLALGGSVDGCAVEYRVFAEKSLVPTPPFLSDLEAATLPCAALTAWSAVATQGGIGRGDEVLTQGAGGVSLFALQLARARGATVIATSSSAERLERLKALGASHLINYREDREWGRTARALTGGRGVNHVVEVGGAGTLAQSIRAVRVGGTVSLIGVLAGAKPDFNLGLVVTQNIRLQGVTVGSRAEFEAMLETIAAHELRPVIDRVFPLSELRAAIEYLATGRHFGKICIAL
ncbi:MAG TPA: NAD(P)-dependent alcohol dehydrogenase [Stellaceae bacterium]|nr:NAD(P)-dependent alcohol dehydrogenase [Stellaceae bacterium]